MVTTVFRKKIDTDDEVTCEHPVLLPQHVLRYLLESGLDMPPEAVCEYWKFHRDMSVPWAIQHESDGTHIPLGLYGDAAKYGETNSKKVWGIWLNLVLFRPKSVRLSRYLLFAVDHETSFGIRTLFPLLRACVEDLNSIYEAGILGRKFCVTEIRGDWEFHYLAFRLKRYWQSSSFCWRCRATRGLYDPVETCYLDLTDSPGWKSTQHATHGEFLHSVIPSAGPRSFWAQ